MRARVLKSLVLVAIALLACATGCGLLFDFGKYDTDEPTREAGVQIVDGVAATFSITAISPSPATWRAGGPILIHVQIARANGFTEPVTLTASSLPTGITAADSTIAGDASEGDLQLAADLSAHAGPLLRGGQVVAKTANGISDARPLDIQLVGAAGQPDVTFGDGGVQSLSIVAAAAILDPDDKIVVGGTLGASRASIERFTADGEPDVTFGAAGTSTPLDAGFGVGMTADDAGYVLATVPNIGSAKSLLRVDRAGVMVPSYGTAGSVALPTSSAFVLGSTPVANDTVVVDEPTLLGPYRVKWFAEDGTAELSATGLTRFPALAIQANGQVVVVSDRLHAARYTADAGLDPTFADPSDAAAALPTASPTALAITPDGYVVAGAFAPYGLVKLRADGTPDPSFGTGGFSTEAEGRLGVGDGGIVYVARGMGVARISPAGSQDPLFISTFDGSDTASAVLIQRSGKIVVAGATSLRRYWP